MAKKRPALGSGAKLEGGGKDMESAAQTKRNLGRGLAALFGEENEDYAALDKVRATKEIAIERLHPCAKQPRRHFDPEKLEELAASIAENGIIQPILVRRHPERPSDYEIVAGERRWRAAQAAKLHEVPVVIRELDDRQTVELALVENIQRADLTALEEAAGFQRLMADHGYTQESVAKAVGKSRSHVANTLRLMALPDGPRALLDSGQISPGHARALLGLPESVAEDLARQVVAKGLTVRATERLAKLAGGAAKASRSKSKGKTAPVKDPDTLALEHDLSQLLGLKVSIALGAKGGQITVHYDTLEQLDDVLTRLSQDPRRR